MTANVPPIVMRAAERATHDHQGIVGYRLHQTTELHAARFYNRSDNFEMAVVFDGDTLVKVRIFSYTENGRDASEGDKAKIQAQLEERKPNSGFAVPFDARHFAEYRYVQNGMGALFISLARDDRHGDGEFVVNARGDVTRMTYTPDVLPKYATSASIVDDRSEVLPSFWATVREVQRYEGKYGPFHGYGEIVTQERDFNRFQNRAAALTALAHGDI